MIIVIFIIILCTSTVHQNEPRKTYNYPIVLECRVNEAQELTGRGDDCLADSP